jgi:hypothetical protein
MQEKKDSTASRLRVARYKSGLTKYSPAQGLAAGRDQWYTVAVPRKMDSVRGAA